MRRLILAIVQSVLFQAFAYTATGSIVGAWAGVQLYETVLQVAAAMPAPVATYGPTPVPSRTPNGGTDANARFPIPMSVTPVALRR